MVDVLVRISAPHFVAGLVARSGVAVRTAPIIRYMVGWTGEQVANYCDKRRWTWERV